MADTDDIFSTFDIDKLKVEVNADNGGTKQETLRIFHLKDLDSLMLDALEMATYIRHFGENEDDRDFYDNVIQLASLHDILPRFDKSHNRFVNSKHFEDYESLKQLLEMTGDQDCPRITSLLQNSEQESIDDLFAKATYANPEILIPVHPETYVEFRERFLEEMMAVRTELIELASKAARKKMQEVLNNPNSTQEQLKLAHDVLNADDVFEIMPELNDTSDRIESMLMNSAIRIEEEGALPYQELVNEVGIILEEVASRIYRDGSVESVSQADSIISTTLRISDSIRCLEQIVQVGGNFPDTLGSDAENMCISAIDSMDPLELYDALTWVRENLVNRNECLRLVFREAEACVELLMELALDERYRVLRRHMTRSERRLFRFMYSRSTHVGDRIPYLNLLGRNFALGMGAQNAELFLSVIAYKGSKEQVEELKKRWTAYLELHPFWVDLLRFDDRERKRTRSRPFTPLEEDSLASQSVFCGYKNLPGGQTHVSEWSVESLTEKYCTETQSAYITQAYVEKKTHDSIAKESGVTQQAVSKAISAGLTKIRNGLEQNGLVRPKTNLRKKGA